MTNQLDVNHPDVTVGYAMIDPRGAPFPDTVCSTERGAMVNALGVVFSEWPTADWSDAKIIERFKQYACGVYQISPVAIERLIVEDDSEEASE